MLLALARKSKKFVIFYGKDNNSALWIVTYINEWFSDDVICESCKDKFGELTQSERCRRFANQVRYRFY